MRSPDDRGVSSVLGYLLNFAIVGILVVSLTTVAVGFFGTTTDAVVEDDLEAVGNNIAGTIQATDRLTRQSDSSSEIGQTARVASEVRGEDYVVEVINSSVAVTGPPPGSEIEYDDECSRACIVMASTDGDALASVNFVSRTNILSSRFSGGDVYLYRPDGGSSIQISTINR